MAFSELSEYSEGVFPECGMASSYTICEGAASYKPIDVSGLQGAIDSAISTAMNNTKDNIDKISNKVDVLADEWGKKYIAIDKHDLNIVDPDNYSTNFSSVNNNLEEQKSRCDEIVKAIVSKTEKVNDYLNQLEENNKKYKKLIDKYNEFVDEKNSLIGKLNHEQSKAEPNMNVVYSLQSNISIVNDKMGVLDSEIKKYEASRIDSPDGSWVLG